MKTESKILFAFLLNFLFSVFEAVGGVLTGSIAILSDAVHDLGDALTIGFSRFLEHKSKKAPDAAHTYGYSRYSVLGGAVSTLVLILGSGLVIVGAVRRLLNPQPINYNGMLIFAIVGVIVNLFAAYFTHGSHSINERAVNLHMLEDVFGWIIVLFGSIFMKFTDLAIIDPLISIFVAVFIIINALKNEKEILDLFLLKTPKDISQNELISELLKIDSVNDVHHLHVFSLDGESHVATVHIVAEKDVKHAVREVLKEHGVHCATIETEDTLCNAPHCHSPHTKNEHCHHHH